MCSRRALNTACVFAAIVVGVMYTSQLRAADEQKADLWSIRTLRGDGRHVDYAAVDARLNELLEKYSDDPQMQGRLYLEALMVHTLSGLSRTDLATAYAEKAAECPLDPADKAQVYLAWGDTAQMSYAGASGDRLRTGRREAATLYLKSMRVALDNDVPQAVGERPACPEGLPRSEALLREGMPGYPPEMLKRLIREQQERLAELQARFEAWQKADAEWRFQRELIKRRDFSRDMTVKLYATLPFDTPELERLATQILEDKDAVNDLVSRTNARAKEAMDRAGWKLPDLLVGNELEEEKRLRRDLSSITAFRQGLKTDYEGLQERVNTLLSRYSDRPAAQGRICLEALMVHALSGLTRPKEAVEVARQTEAYPLCPRDKAQLYLSWGNAEQFMQPGAKGDVLRGIRREAAIKYLQSMKVALDNDLPTSAGPRPSISPALLLPESILASEQQIEGLPIHTVKEARQLTPAERERIRTQYRQDLERWTVTKEVRARTEYSRDLIVSLYSTLPFDTPELERLATEILEDEEAVDDLVNRTNARIKELMNRAD